jgi:hypothetical protein
MKARFPNRAVLRAQIWDATPFSAISGALNLNEPLPALATFDTAVFDKPLNFAVVLPLK